MPHPILATAMAVGIAATAGAGALGDAPPTVNVTANKHVSATRLTAVVTPNALYSAAPASDVVVLGAHGSLAVGEPRGVPQAGALAGASRAVPGGLELSTGLATSRVHPLPERVNTDIEMVSAPTTSGPALRLGRATTPSVGSTGPAGAAAPGLFSLLIGNGDEPGENGGWLIGNGADGGPGQDGGRGGLLFGNGGRGGDALTSGGPAGRGGDAACSAMAATAAPASSAQPPGPTRQAAEPAGQAATADC
ncbi:hypothetical protein [Mycolicibacterium vanbaalenii]|uniref:hypothetical protein n=1 Tax=Mycolicibacterium vanbaalenii TaxID=110539 RepID=UPI0021F35F09|nr:hypothetical protein [Mycolicibacterium vanbaalenii]MCV7130816.1 hypothetical protein [Mycolicibacterium vanbaalenii PYR-1]